MDKIVTLMDQWPSRKRSAGFTRYRTPASGTPPLGACKKIDVNLFGSPALNDETWYKSLNDNDLYKSSNDDEALYKSSSLGAAGGRLYPSSFAQRF